MEMSQIDRDSEAGKRLRELRIASRKSQEDVSFSASLDQSSLSKVERQGPRACSWPRFCAIAEALGYEVDVVFRPIQDGDTQ